MINDTRATTYGAVSTTLALLGDRELADLLDRDAVPFGTGIGGTSAVLDVEGTRVFVKRVSLTELELRPDHARSTADLYGLPLSCQYGLGAPSFGAWRELAAHTMTTTWALTGGFTGVPLLYHWRVLPHVPPALPPELADVDATVAYWEDSPGVRRRLEDLAESPASIVLFLEHFPHNLHDWLNDRLRDGDIEPACDLVDTGLREALSFLNARGLMHFDAHFENILTDGHRLYVGDYGLAVSARFALSPDERDFYHRHLVYDRAYACNHLVLWMASAHYTSDRDERSALIRAWAAGERPTGVPDGVAAVLSRYAPLSAVVDDFRRRVRTESRKTPFPVAELRRVLEPLGRW